MAIEFEIAGAFSMLFLAAYIFLLRVPSEALPMARGGAELSHGEQSSIYKEGDKVYLKLKKRKNMPSGDLISRGCWCAKCRRTCPVHVLWKFFEKLEIGTRPFSFIRPATATRVLRGALATLGVADASLYRPHDFRRGHAQDMLKAKSTVKDILLAGRWRSPKFLEYLDLGVLEEMAVMETHMGAVLDESSSDDEACQ